MIPLSPDFLSKYAIQQNPKEFAALLRIAAGCRSILEIGSCLGGSTVELAHAMPKGSRIVAMDLCKPKKFPADLDVEAYLKHRVEEIRAEGYDAHLIVGDSRNPELVRAAFRLSPYDLVFIDGDHSQEGCSADWLNYGHMGKIVAFHDIRGCPGVTTVWDELRGKYRTEEYIEGRDMGIGMLWME